MALMSGGRFENGHRGWRPYQIFRDKEWLENEYITKQKCMREIADEFRVTAGAIRFWLHKHNITGRSQSESKIIQGQWVGTKNPKWQGGIAGERQSLYASTEWSMAVKNTWERDNGKCRKCTNTTSVHGLFHIHHIVSFRNVDLRLNEDNLLLVCPNCHKWIHGRHNFDKQFINSLPISMKGFNDYSIL